MSQRSHTRHLLRTSRLVSSAVRRSSIAAALPYEKLHADTHRYDPADDAIAARDGLQPHEPVRVYARPRRRHLLHVAVPRAPRSTRRPRDQRVGGVADRDLEGVPDHAVRASGRAVSEGARDSSTASRPPDAADGLRFPVVVKPNIGGSGAGIRRFDTIEQLVARRGEDALQLGIDSTALVQEYVPADAGRIVRVEVLNGRYLYAIRIYTPGDSFNLCPADVCQSVDGAELASARRARSTRRRISCASKATRRRTTSSRPWSGSCRRRASRSAASST